MKSIVEPHDPKVEIKVEIEFEVEGYGDCFEVDGQKVRTFRVYSDNVWELLDKDGLPIQQGWVKNKSD